jgi:hypothetical protein
MQKSLSVALAAIVFMVVGSMSVLAQSASTLPGVMSFCPQGNQANSCAAAMNDFIGQNPKGAQTDISLNQLVGDIASIGQDPATPRRVCLGLADGIRAASGGVQSGATAQSYQELADSLCAQGIRVSSTGGGGASSIHDGGGKKTPPTCRYGGTYPDCRDEPSDNCGTCGSISPPGVRRE